MCNGRQVTKQGKKKSQQTNNTKPPAILKTRHSSSETEILFSTPKVVLVSDAGEAAAAHVVQRQAGVALSALRSGRYRCPGGQQTLCWGRICQVFRPVTWRQQRHAVGTQTTHFRGCRKHLY